MNNLDLTTKRRVEISVGKPDMLTEMPLNIKGLPKEMPHHDECYFINFVDIADSDGGQNGFVAQTLCLCQLKYAAACWLQGGTETDVQAVLNSGHDEDSDNEADAGEEWKKS